MENPNDRTLAQLQAYWTRWQIWIVYKLIGGPTWCARLHSDHKKIINADSAEHLAEYLEDEVSDPAGEIPRLDTPMTGALLRDLYPGWEISRDEVFGVWQAERRRGSEVHFLAATEPWELERKIRAAGQAE
jgi:hypothetical protein